MAAEEIVGLEQFALFEQVDRKVGIFVIRYIHFYHLIISLSFYADFSIQYLDKIIKIILFILSFFIQKRTKNKKSGKKAALFVIFCTRIYRESPVNLFESYDSGELVGKGHF